MKRYYAFLLLLFSIQPIFAQGEAAIPSLVIQRSPFLFGAGEIGAAIPTTNADGFYYNPAQLGYFSKENNFSIFFMPQKTDWLPKVFSGIHINSFSAAAGYNFNKDNNGLPLSIGVGYMHSTFDYGDVLVTTAENPDGYGLHRASDYFDSFSAGAGFDYYLNFNLGISVKSYTSDLVANHTVNGTAFDFGAMITAPFSKLFFDNYKAQFSDGAFLKPKFDLTLGYSLTNVGKKIYYVDPAQSDPIPRTARLGYNLDFAIDLYTDWLKNINVIDYSFTAEADDILISQDNNGNSEYQGLFGDISIGKHLINLNGDSKVIVHKGHVFCLFETLIITSGRFNGRGYDYRKTNGIGVSSEGIFKILKAAIDKPVTNYIADHIVVEYYSANIFADMILETNMKGLVINYKGFEF